MAGTQAKIKKRKGNKNKINKAEKGKTKNASKSERSKIKKADNRRIKIKELKINESDFYKQAFDRNIGIFSVDEQQKLRQCKVAIPGMGGVGGIHALTMARLGIGNFHIADLDKFEVVNFNRQAGASISTLNEEKAKVMQNMIKDINPFAGVKVFSDGINEGNIDDFLDGVDIVIDGIDFFEFETRRMLFKACQEKAIPVITAGPLGFSCAMLIFTKDSMKFDDYFDIDDDMPCFEKIIHFAMGLAPSALHVKYIDMSKVDLRRQKGPSSIIACNLAGAMAATEAVKILLGRDVVDAVPHYFQFDPYRMKLKKGYLVNGNKSLLQKIKIWVVKKFILK